MLKLRHLFLSLVIVAISFNAFADRCVAYTSGNGYARYGSLAAVKHLTDAPTAGVVLPGDAHGAVISVSGASIRYRTDGTSPTSSEGVLIPAGTVIIFTPETSPQLATFAFIQTASSAEVTISYCH